MALFSLTLSPYSMLAPLAIIVLAGWGAWWFRRILNRQRTAKKMLASALEATDNGILVVDGCGKVIHRNRRFVKMWRIPEEMSTIDDEKPLLAHACSQLSDPDGFKRKIERLCLKPEEESFDSLTFKDGRVFEGASLPMIMDGKPIGRVWSFRDISGRKRTEEALEKRMASLVCPADDTIGVTIEDLFNLADIQRLQDEFALATGVASIITHTDGTPITAPSSFCQFCIDVVRKTEKGRANCYKSDATLGRLSAKGPTIQPCMSGGLWDAGAGISVGGRHIANWLIGQVRDETQTEDKMRAYAREIEADETVLIDAFRKVPAMSHERFKRVSQFLFTLANQLSSIAYHNLQQARFITERKTAEEELQRLKNYLASIINSSPSVIIGMDDSGVVTHWNKQAEIATGKTPEEAVGKPASAFLPEFQPSIELLMEKVAKGRVRASLEKQPIVRNGEKRYFDIVAFPLGENEWGKAVIRIEDVTDRAHIQEVIVQNEKMLSLGGLAAGMAHEINNPLGIISLAVQNVERRVISSLPANKETAEKLGTSLDVIVKYFEMREIPQFIQTIKLATTRASKIVANMLQFSRMSKSERAPAALADMLDHVVELAASDFDLKKRFDFKEVKIVRNYEPQTPPVPLVAVEIEQVLLNIIKNAAQAMMGNPPDRPPLLTLGVRLDGGFALVEVADNGHGIHENIRHRLFEPFFTTKPPGEGTGLGLSVSYMIVVKNHKGHIDVESTPNVGTVFSIRLPVE